MSVAAQPHARAVRRRPPGDARARLLAAAARVFAGHGAAGATSRRIADEAGVNEVTLFRLFGTKEALLGAAVHAAVHDATDGEPPTRLPAVPVDPEREVAEWCTAEIGRLGRSRALLRQCLAESGVPAGHARAARTAVAGTAEVLRAYVGRMAGRAPLGDAPDREAAVSMLVSTVVADALGRDDLAGVHALPAAEAPARYARAFLRALGRASARDGEPARWEWASPADTPPSRA